MWWNEHKSAQAIVDESDFNHNFVVTGHGEI
jgi:hypothetical protein